jgi:hypothetical protein
VSYILGRPSQYTPVIWKECFLSVNFDLDNLELKEGTLMAEEKTRKCGHPACACTVSGKEKYCSEYCKDAKDLTELTCTCEHPECRG